MEYELPLNHQERLFKYLTVVLGILILTIIAYDLIEKPEIITLHGVNLDKDYVNAFFDTIETGDTVEVCLLEIDKCFKVTKYEEE